MEGSFRNDTLSCLNFAARADRPIRKQEITTKTNLRLLSKSVFFETFETFDVAFDALKALKLALKRFWSQFVAGVVAAYGIKWAKAKCHHQGK